MTENVTQITAINNIYQMSRLQRTPKKTKIGIKKKLEN